MINSELLKVLREVIPGIPVDCTSVRLKLKAGALPVIECEFLVKDAGGLSTKAAVFEVTDMKQHQVIG
jgi:hypothetical protein